MDLVWEWNVSFLAFFSELLQKTPQNTLSSKLPALVGVGGTRSLLIRN